MDILSSVSITSFYSWDWGFRNVWGGEQSMFCFGGVFVWFFSCLFNCGSVGSIFFLFLWGFGFLVELGFHCLFGVFEQKGSPHISVNQWTQCTAFPNKWFAPAHIQVVLRPLPDFHHYTHSFLVLGKPKLDSWGPQMCSQVSFPALLFTLHVNTAQHTGGLCHKGRLLSHAQFPVHQDTPQILSCEAALEPAGPSPSSSMDLLHLRCIGCFWISQGFFHTLSPA